MNEFIKNIKLLFGLYFIIFIFIYILNYSLWVKINNLEKNQQYIFKQIEKFENPDIQFEGKLYLKDFGE